MRPLTLSWIPVFLSVVAAMAGEQSISYRLTVEAGDHDRVSTPVRVVLSLPDKWADQAVTLTAADGTKLPAQLTPLPLNADEKAAEPGRSRRELWWVLPSLAAGKSVEFTATITLGKPRANGFRWEDTQGEHVDLLRGERPVVRYMYQAYEDDPAKRDSNNKPFHHVFSPDGKQLVTKGSGGNYTHHQGLFYGFTRCNFDGGRCNTWYCHEGEHELHKGTLQQLVGPVVGRHRTEIDWNDTTGKPFCREVRELTAFAVDGGTLLEWHSRLESVRGTVTLDGDAQHAGFQFRAADEVAAKTKSQTYYLRPDGPGKPGTTRNPARGKGGEDLAAAATKQVTNLPWNAMSFVLGDARFTAAYLDHPSNPKPAIYSERDYGRFGSWFGKQALEEGGEPIELRYRVWLQDGEMTVEEAASLSRDFVAPPKVTVADAE